MATFKYFCDLGDEPELLQAITQMANSEFLTRWPGVRGLRADGYSMWVGKGTDGVLPATRKIELRRFPSLHRCNAKCLGGKPTGVCECQCSGKNHGRQLFSGLISTSAATARAIGA